MTTSATQEFLSEIIAGKRIPSGKLGYFEARLTGLVHQAMLKIFGKLERQKGFTRRDLAHRIGRKPEQITRWFSYPGNLTLETVSDIFVGTGYELESIVLTNLTTSEKITFPEQPMHIGGLRLLGESPTMPAHRTPNLAVDAVDSMHPGKAESDQMTPRARPTKKAASLRAELATA
jgi:hypothetical protein